MTPSVSLAPAPAGDGRSRTDRQVLAAAAALADVGVDGAADDRARTDDRDLDREVLQVARLGAAAASGSGPGSRSGRCRSCRRRRSCRRPRSSSKSIRLRSTVRLPSWRRSGRRHSSTRESMPRARKSILTKPASSQESLSHWQMKRPSIAAGWTGTSSTSGVEEMTMPPTCWLTWRGKPASSPASSTRWRQGGAFMRAAYSGRRAISSARCAAERGSLSLAMRSSSAAGRPSALPTSRTARRRR